MASNIGLIGLATMGANLARNIERNGFTISLFNRTVSKVDDFVQEFGEGKNFVGCHSVEEFVGSLAKPRKILLMVKAGDPVDATIAQLVPHLEEGDIIIDGGNSFFQDTIRRTEELEVKGLRFMGVGVSGGEEGALNGPSIMPGGTKEAWNEVKEILQKIAAKAEDGEPCCDYVGENGAGHYVKMVHNGIEYGDMQLISEAYDILKNMLKFNNEEMADIFEKWNKGKLSSYLIEIAADVLRKKDDRKDGHLIDAILDIAGSKGTGKWTSQNALELGVPLPTITAAVFERAVSTLKDERIEAAKLYPVEARDVEYSESLEAGRAEYVEQLENSLYAAKISTYAQGMFLIKKAAEEYNWDIDLGNTAKLWRAGCIIRAKLLQNITEAYQNNPNLSNLLLDPFFIKEIREVEDDWHGFLGTVLEDGAMPIPAFASSLSYFNSFRNGRLPTNMIQGLRDYFGAHTYQRIDQEGTFHAGW